MNITETNIADIIIGALILGLGLLYLTTQYKLTEEVTEIAEGTVLQENNLYQQFNDDNISRITDEELYAILMGYREYPIKIDDTVIAAGDMDYSKYISFIREGYYLKSYVYNPADNINQIVYTFVGTNAS